LIVLKPDLWKLLVNLYSHNVIRIAECHVYFLGTIIRNIKLASMKYAPEILSKLQIVNYIAEE